MDRLPRLNKSQFRRVKKLIRRLCANCEEDRCILLDDGTPCPCPQMISHTLLCKYFRATVLPEDRDLFGEIMTVRPAKRCCVCGVPVFSHSNSAKYCPACAVRERRRRDRERKAKAASRFRK